MECRAGAFDTTVQFTDGTSIKCEKRERSQIVVGANGKPITLTTTQFDRLSQGFDGR